MIRDWQLCVIEEGNNYGVNIIEIDNR